MQETETKESSVESRDQAATPAPPAPPPPPTMPPWPELSDQELLRYRISDLKVKIEGSVVEQRIQQLYAELAAKGLQFRPPCYLSTEWLTPDRIPAVGIPFYLAHPRLIKLERLMMVEAEGESEKECMKLLRHETGHAINYAYRLYRRSRWRELFGNMSVPYDPHRYIMRPYSKQFVVHLKGNYAQAHPDEDFTETFAVWLTPGLDWRKKYAGWGALKKLEYVDHLMQSIAQKAPDVTGGPRYWAAAKTRSTLETYYKNKRRVFGEGYLGFYDPLLLKLFTPNAGNNAQKAFKFLTSHRKSLINVISDWSRLPKYSVQELVMRLSQRAREMQLYVREDQHHALFSIGICLTAQLLAEQNDYRNITEES
ncbi:MAG TPA: putative zinc-binding metallopeptidase [Kiritimatiellia bacterium]|nr:putative zinc-binding metallopeptidase [Kiritimatiellia bacterium]